MTSNKNINNRRSLSGKNGRSSRIKISREDWSTRSNNFSEGKRSDPGSASHITDQSNDFFNEVSLNVLENAAAKSSESKGFAGNDYSHRTILSSDEVLRGKRRKGKKFDFARQANGRINKKVMAITILLVSVVAFVLVFAVVSSTNIFQKESEPLKLAFNSIASVDKTIVRLNSLIEGEIDQEKIDSAKITHDDLEDTKDELYTIKERIDYIMTTVDASSDDYVNAQYAYTAIDSRISMLDYGIAVFDRAVQAVEDIQEADDMWNQVLEANDYLKESDELISLTDQIAYNEALDASNKALNCLYESNKNIDKLISKNLNYDFSNYKSYILSRIESVQHSIASIQAIINVDADAAIVENNKYFETENKASDFAQTLDGSPGQYLRSNYDKEVKSYVDNYKKARQNAASNDSMIRNYLKIW